MSTRTFTSWALLVAATAAWSCNKGSTADSAAAPSAGSATALHGAASSSAGTAAAPPAASAGSAAGSPASASGWSGSYTAKVGAVAPPEAAHEKTWTQDPGKSAIGEGTIELAVDQSGKTTGEAKGALGDLTVSGTFDGRELRANLQAKNPNAENAMTGFMTLAAEGDPSSAKSLNGVLRVSNRDAKLVREASVQLARK